MTTTHTKTYTTPMMIRGARQAGKTTQLLKETSALAKQRDGCGYVIAYSRRHADRLERMCADLSIDNLHIFTLQAYKGQVYVAGAVDAWSFRELVETTMRLYALSLPDPELFAIDSHQLDIVNLIHTPEHDD